MSDDLDSQTSPKPSFKSWWSRKTGRDAAKNFKFVNLGPESVGTKEASLSSESAVAVEKPRKQDSRRRQQVHQAQTLHRSRKAEYLKSLETELGQLRQAETNAAIERDRFAAENESIRSVLKQNGVPCAFSPPLTSPPLPYSIDPAIISIRPDDIMDDTRLFVKRSSDSSHSSPLHTSSDASRSRDVSQSSVEDATFLAVDFILALEHNCTAHVWHPSVSPVSQPPAVPGHGMTMIARIYGHATPISASLQDTHAPPVTGPGPQTVPDWYIPYAEVERLVQLSESLDTQDDEITPAQAYKYLADNARFAELPDSVIEQLKRRLGSIVTCYDGSYGAVLKADNFFAVASDILGSRLAGTGRE